MSDPMSKDNQSLSSTILGQIELICDRFESAWRGETRPRIEDYWQEADGPDLLRELLVPELAYRIRCDDHPSPVDYRLRFVAHPEVIRSAFATVPAGRPSPGPPAPASSGSSADRNLLFGVRAEQYVQTRWSAAHWRRSRSGGPAASVKCPAPNTLARATVSYRAGPTRTAVTIGS
jgi:hypothetical protein